VQIDGENDSGAGRLFYRPCIVVYIDPDTNLDVYSKTVDSTLSSKY